MAVREMKKDTADAGVTRFREIDSESSRQKYDRRSAPNAISSTGLNDLDVTLSVVVLPADAMAAAVDVISDATVPLDALTRDLERTADAPDVPAGREIPA